MKKGLCLILFCVFCFNVSAADMTLNFIISDAKVAKAKAGFLRKKPNREKIADPEWVDPQDGSNAPRIKKYTDNQWIKEKIRREIVEIIEAGNKLLHRENNAYQKDNDVVN